MSDEILTLQLAAASGCLRSDWSRQGKQWCTTHGGDWPLCKAAALLPVVRQARADELDLAALLTVPSQDSAEEIREALFRRATALRGEELT